MSTPTAELPAVQPPDSQADRAALVAAMRVLLGLPVQAGAIAATGLRRGPLDVLLPGGR